jgi:hypothetical protein
MAWSGLHNTPTFQSLYPENLPDGSLNPQKVDIINTLIREQNNQPMINGQGNMVAPKGTKCP